MFVGKATLGFRVTPRYATTLCVGHLRAGSQKVVLYRDACSCGFKVFPYRLPREHHYSLNACRKEAQASFPKIIAHGLSPAG